MNKICLLGMALLCACAVFGQQSLKIKVTHADTKEPLVSATVSIPSINKSGITDSSGVATISNLSPGKYEVLVSYVGFSETKVSLTVPLSDTPFEIGMEPEDEEEEEVIIQSTRTSRTIKNTPTRVETIELEEIDEKSNMRPSNVSMLLHESTGIQVQQTSATSGNASIRIQGLDGKYTQLLKDGFAGFGNFASGLSVLEIHPLI
jgi:outer membrane receptor for ferrienterochelin and colicins